MASSEMGESGGKEEEEEEERSWSSMDSWYSVLMGAEEEEEGVGGTGRREGRGGWDMAVELRDLGIRRGRGLEG